MNLFQSFVPWPLKIKELEKWTRAIVSFIMAEYSGRTECDIRPCHSYEFPSPVKCPAYSVLDKTKFKETFGVVVPFWTDSLKACISNLTNK